MRVGSSVVIVLMALAALPWAQAQSPAQPPAARPAKAAPSVKPVAATMSADPLPSSVDPRVCLEFPTSAQVIACAERYRPRKRQA